MDLERGKKGPEMAWSCIELVIPQDLDKGGPKGKKIEGGNEVFRTKSMQVPYLGERGGAVGPVARAAKGLEIAVGDRSEAICLKLGHFGSSARWPK